MVSKILTTLEALEVNAEGKPWRVETYATTTEQGLAVMQGDDTIVDLPFNAGWSKKEVQRHANLYVELHNLLPEIIKELGRSKELNKW